VPADPGNVIAQRYRVLRPLGKGGMGEVYAAENTRTGRQVALKLLRAESKQKQSAIERFRREARAAGSINSDFVTQVLDVEDDPEHGIVLVFELLEGESLVERLKRTGPVPYEELWGIVEAVWMGLADAHAAGIVHRDLKPSNVFLEQRRSGTRVKILDFGISKLPKPISGESLTQVGQSLGTFSFMPPEQIGKAKSVDHRADIYACTTLIYQAMSGKLPYQAKNVVRMMELKTKTEPRTLGEVMREPVDPSLEAFIARGLARNPDHRFQTAVEALESWRKLRPPGAASVTDTEPAGPPRIGGAEDEDSSDDAKTRVIGKKQVLAHAEAARARAGSLTDPASPAVTPEERFPGVQSTQPFPQQQRDLISQEHTMPDVDAASFSGPAPAVQRASFPQVAPQGPPAQGQPSPLEGRLSANPARVGPSRTTGGMRSTLTLVLGAIGLMLVGFIAVAVVLHLIN
jgi:eukaryotic-like serine/threonine-protein kinase